ncbi:hypothetical protein [Pantanalinema sp. GBBB05]|uniref:hypothetical protein n=1 Tax=Pantanalinema sp. GBBB05 TaxID=2604139 RepID=UPI001DC85F1B|nr:hypothetical protein [Pantanalinema sp. GBBB05]
MPRQRRPILLPVSSQRRQPKLRSKELDLLVLAGCSCLFTLLYHPVAEALQSPSINQSQSTTSSHMGQTSVNHTNTSSPALPSRREEIQAEEEE